MDEAREQTMFSLTNLTAAPVWLAMILAPRSSVTRRLVRMSDALMAGLCAAYVAHLPAALSAYAELSRAKAWREALSAPRGFLAGWTHFTAFDLFVGRWIWETGLRENRSTRAALLLTLLAGPSGLGLFALQRRSLRTT